MARSYRALAMGNTGVASANDSSALFYNPAVLANVKGWWLDYAAWTVEVSEGFNSEDAGMIIADVSYPYLNREGLTNETTEQFLARENPYLRANSHITYTASLMDEGLSIAAAYMIENTIATIDGGDNVYHRDDLVKKIGLSIPLARGKLVFGFAWADIARRESIDPSSDAEPNWGNQETGKAYDIGILYRMANKARMTWGLVVYNYGGTEFGSSVNAIEQSYAFGVSMNHEVGIFKFVPAVDVRQIGSTSDRKNTLHAGLEIGLFPNATGGSYLSYRVGWNDGYASTGLELNLFNRYMVLGYSSYGEEVGDESEKSESRRSVYYFSMGF